MSNQLSRETSIQPPVGFRAGLSLDYQPRLHPRKLTVWVSASGSLRHAQPSSSLVFRHVPSPHMRLYRGGSMGLSTSVLQLPASEIALKLYPSTRLSWTLLVGSRQPPLQ